MYKSWSIERVKLAHRVSNIQPFHVMALLARAKHLQSLGHDVIHLEVGEPDFDTPAPIVEAGIEALRQGENPLHACPWVA
jgi:aspartate/methionine/tyrosine aminotransferase